MSDYYAKNRERILMQARLYRLKNKEKLRRRRKIYNRLVKYNIKKQKARKRVGRRYVDMGMKV